MFDGDKSYEEKLSKEGGGGCNSKRVIKGSFTEKVIFESDGMRELARWLPGRRALQAEGAEGTKAGCGHVLHV